MISLGIAEVILSQIQDFAKLWWLSIVAAKVLKMVHDREYGRDKSVSEPSDTVIHPFKTEKNSQT